MLLPLFIDLKPSPPPPPSYLIVSTVQNPNFLTFEDPRHRFRKIISVVEGGIGSENESIPAYKVIILWDMADFIPYFVPTQFQERIFPPITPRPKILVFRSASAKTSVGDEKSIVRK